MRYIIFPVVIVSQHAYKQFWTGSSDQVAMSNTVIFIICCFLGFIFLFAAELLVTKHSIGISSASVYLSNTFSFFSFQGVVAVI